MVQISNGRVREVMIHFHLIMGGGGEGLEENLKDEKEVDLPDENDDD